jgi:hypothetical protein
MTAAAGRCDGQVLGVGTGQPSKEFHKHISGRAQLCWPSILGFKRSLRGQKMFQPKLGYARNPVGETGSVVGEKSSTSTRPSADTTSIACSAWPGAGRAVAFRCVLEAMKASEEPPHSTNAFALDWLENQCSICRCQRLSLGRRCLAWTVNRSLKPTPSARARLSCRIMLLGDFSSPRAEGFGGLSDRQ